MSPHLLNADKVLLIARHGNTFSAGETPRRVGARTDLPLVEKGFEQGRHIGAYLKAHDLRPSRVYTSALQRTIQTADAALKAAGLEVTTQIHDMFNEIDYGPDENLTEEEVIARLGEDALAAWDKDGITPDGWSPDAKDIKNDWLNFGQDIAADTNHRIEMVVTSNGVARFAPYLTGDFEGFAAAHDIKIATGGLCIMYYSDNAWHVEDWNIKPPA